MKAIFFSLGALGIIVLGGVATAVIDMFLGVSFENISAIARITHMVVYMLWGAGLAYFFVK